MDELDETATHLVARVPGTDKFRLGMWMPGCQVVQLAWLEACIAENRYVSEERYLFSGEPSGPKPAITASALDDMDDEIAAALGPLVSRFC